jgi:hypothetical protein
MQSIDARAAELRQKLVEKGAVTVYAFYDGYADSGGIETVEVNSAAGDLIDLDESLRDQVVDLFYDLLEERFSGWADDTGANGEFTWDVRTDALHHTHNERYEDYNTTEMHGWSCKVSEADPHSDEEGHTDA